MREQLLRLLLQWGVMFYSACSDGRCRDQGFFKAQSSIADGIAEAASQCFLKAFFTVRGLQVNDAAAEALGNWEPLILMPVA